MIDKRIEEETDERCTLGGKTADPEVGGVRWEGWRDDRYPYSSKTR